MPHTALLLVLLAASPQNEAAHIYYDYIENGKLAGGRITVDTDDPGTRAWLGLDAPVLRGTWAVTTVVDNGPTDNRIDIVVLGDGYTSANMSAYASQVQNVVNGFFAQQPLAAYAPYFNVHRVDVISNESGVDEPDYDIYRDTALDMSYNCGGTARLLCVNTSAAIAAAASAPDVDQILVLANSTRYGGAGYPWLDLGTLAGNNSSSLEVALHEFGHSFADLADEYDYGGSTTYGGSEPSDANVSIYDSAAMLAQQRKWWRWLDLAHVDVFEGAYYSQLGIYRPTYDSKMRSLNRPFQEVNSEQLILSAYETVSPLDDATPPSAVPLPACTEFTVTPLAPNGHELAVQWSIDGAEVNGATGTTFTPGAATTLSPGEHTVSVTVIDSTTAVRDEGARDLMMKASRQWPIRAYEFGDVNLGGGVNLDDVLCTLDTLAGKPAAWCDAADLSQQEQRVDIIGAGGACGPDGRPGVDDLLALLDTLGGSEVCAGSCGS